METEYLDGCITAARHVVRKVAAVEGKLVWLMLQQLLDIKSNDNTSGKALS